MLRYKIKVLDALKDAGYTTTRIRREKMLSESTLTRLREGKTSISCDSIGALCVMLRCQPSDILESIVTDAEKIKFF